MPDLVKPAHVRKPIEWPADVNSLARSELRALEKLWVGCRADLDRAGSLQIFWERMARWWSIETGVIEGIFDVSLGVTQTLVT